MSTKKRRLLSSPSSNWSKLPTDLLESVLKRLSFLDMFHLKHVCHSWESSVSKSCLFSSFSQLQPPLLMVPTDHQEYYDDENSNNGCCFFNLEEKLGHYEFKNLRGYDKRTHNCIGSSQGCLIILDKKEGALFIFNPFQIETRKMNLPSCFDGITKAILTSDPICHGKKFGVVIIHGNIFSKIAFLMHGDTKWTDLEGSNGSYAHIMCRENYLFALSDVCSVEIWDFRGLVPVKKGKIEVSFSDKLMEFGECFKDLYTCNLYLVESRGDLLLVKRIIGEFVREDGEVVTEGGLLDDEVYSHLVCPYMTKKFYVYKLDFGGKFFWGRIESLGDEALFLGVNQSESVSALDFQEIKGNSIYFTDDYWDRMNQNEHDMYGGHDMGVFDLKHGSIKQLFPGDLKKFDPAPFWVV